ncbi:Gfo/Idh/MocA family oxidoreductase [Candidatus Latescibacterota bacterium]
MDKVNNNRRSFFGKAVTGGAATVMAASSSKAQAQSKGSSDFFRVGCLNVVSYSHLIGLWGPLINAREGQKDTPFTNMRITHCWDINYDDARDFAKTYRCEAVKNFDDMLGKVDGIISGGYYNHPWNHIIHEPYLEAGLPNLINRPFTNSIKKANKIIDMAKKNNATIVVPSSHEHNESISRAKVWATGKKIICYSATNSFDDYPTHGVHGVYMVCKAIVEAGNPVVAVSYRTKSWYRPPGVLIYEHRDKDGNQFYGSLYQVSGSWGTVQIHTPEAYGGESFNIYTGTGYPFNKTEIWAPTIWAFQNMAYHQEMPQTFDEIYHKTAVFLAGWKSFLDNNGRAVRLTDIPEDWESPCELPNHPEHTTYALFKKKFG